MEIRRIFFIFEVVLRKHESSSNINKCASKGIACCQCLRFQHRLPSVAFRTSNIQPTKSADNGTRHRSEPIANKELNKFNPSERIPHPCYINLIVHPGHPPIKLSTRLSKLYEDYRSHLLLLV